MNRLMMGAKTGEWIFLTTLIVAVLAVVGCSNSSNGLEEHPVVQYPELAGMRTVYREVIDPPEVAPDWQLIDHDGQPMSLSDDLAGRVVVLSFVYSRCPDVCPLLLAHFLTIQRDLRELIDDRVSLVMITVDPEFDTPQRLAQYTDAMNGRWHFLSGTRPELEKAWEGGLPH
ncbi:MAG: SCO family protein [SAR202 cluster bacterium]|nr:SCO family protein [SAR202 cluster bacterium]